MRISDWSSDVCSSDLGHVHQISWGGSLVLLHVFPDNLPTGKCSDPGSRMRPQISSKRSFVKVFTVISGNRRIQQVPLYEPGQDIPFIVGGPVHLFAGIADFQGISGSGQPTITPLDRESVASGKRVEDR